MKEKYSKDYYSGYKESNYFDYSKIQPKKQFKTILSFIEKNKLKGNFLDIGCAYGFLVKEAENYFKKTHGCDVSNYALKKAKNLSKKSDFKKANLDNNLPYPDNYFDLVTAMDVLEHTKDFKKSFEMIFKKVKKGGYMILSFPINSFLRKIFGFLDKDKTHISVPYNHEIMEIIKGSNAKIISKQFFFPLYQCRINFLPAEMELILKK